MQVYSELDHREILISRGLDHFLPRMLSLAVYVSVYTTSDRILCRKTIWPRETREMVFNITLTSHYGLNSYTGELQDAAAVSAAVKDGLASVHFRQVVMQLCSELKSLNKMEEGVSTPQGLYIHEYLQVCVLYNAQGLGPLSIPVIKYNHTMLVSLLFMLHCMYI